MAKKRKGAKKSHRRRRVGGLHSGVKSALMSTVAAVGGAAVGAFVNQAIKTSFPTMPAVTGGALCVAAGAGTLAFMKPSPLVTGFGLGLAGAGGLFAINESVLSLPGIAGYPGMSMPTRYAGAAGINKTVGYAPRGRRVGGTFSGNRSATVAGIMEN